MENTATFLAVPWKSSLFASCRAFQRWRRRAFHERNNCSRASKACDGSTEVTVDLGTVRCAKGI